MGSGFSGKEQVSEPIEIRYKGVFDWEGLYRLIRKWFSDHKYVYIEFRYKDKVAGPFGNEVEVKAAPYRKVSDFLKYNIKLHVKVFDFKEFEIEVDGEKKKVTESRMFINISGNIEFDYNKKFKTDFEKKLLKWMTSALRMYYGAKHFDNLTHSMYQLHQEIKDFLNMETKYYGYRGRPG